MATLQTLRAATLTTPNSPSYDVLSLGEPLLRLSPSPHCPLRMARGFDCHVAGSQLNVAANLAQLGWRTGLVTKVPDHPLGHRVLDACRERGVCIQFAALAGNSKLGITFVEFSTAPRSPRALYDRDGSAASTISPDDFDWESLARSTRYAYTDGIFPGLSESCSESSKAWLTTAKRAGCKTVFDMNYREHLWTPESAGRCWKQLLPHVDVLISNRTVSEQVFGFAGTDEELLQRYANEYGCEVVCLTYREDLSSQRGAFRSVAKQDQLIIESTRREFDIVDRYGTGDAWLSGLLFGIDRHDLAYGLAFADALLALAHTVPGDVPMLTVSEVEVVLRGGAELRLRR